MDELEKAIKVYDRELEIALNEAWRYWKERGATEEQISGAAAFLMQRGDRGVKSSLKALITRKQDERELAVLEALYVQGSERTNEGEHVIPAYKVFDRITTLRGYK